MRSTSGDIESAVATALPPPLPDIDIDLNDLEDDTGPQLKEPPPVGGETEATVLAKLLTAVSVAADRYTQLAIGFATGLDVRDTVEAYTVFKAAAQK